MNDLPRLLRAAQLAERTQYLSPPDSRLQLTVRLIPAGSSCTVDAAGPCTLLLLRGRAQITPIEQPDRQCLLLRGDLLPAVHGYHLQALVTTVLLEIGETSPGGQESA